MARLLLINGPNLNLLGKREPHVYGSGTLHDLEQQLISFASERETELACVQSNHEGDIIEQIHAADGVYDGVILNAGAFTHYSYAIRDAIASVNVPVIEVHISNIHAREPFRHESVIAPVVIGQIVGLGVTGYRLAILALLDKLGEGERAWKN
ncbi:type II 3-dehydroquinate dehydratase [Anoxybacillus rupiensis]|jgi:3-dehydroquinate dehydratase II|uniref:3-dehydroquinate dehydratase n=1 Tax=Anoxybacteroides rupiense TaxID=311460 RepID=A0ABD5ISJ9_9BACL|nr:MULTISPECIES: type II 3-dehydroquinate dehydratase [Anoxybacillus]KXG11235.1 3-dehydroquinate dehydratase [Anoxybacillus sp. P3H1B]MBB3906813.1 3-dehydroquinate dehydratase-2 [Anoxybacillus rupiensis]MBS2770076.1 type II 3-dehydroquinate dehydratase [Anoxybacillus rupiensis]MDE8562552.1 type II 3-dehydroquinate dehydratase [Anoxybacillus rupiensis]MED5050799.1 type II 3-dehydroquinate dehydratase [Anoxybacillus rupiensis]